MKSVKHHNQAKGTLFHRQHGLIYRKDIDDRAYLCVPQNCLEDVFEMAHDAQFHAGQRKMMAALDGLSRCDGHSWTVEGSMTNKIWNIFSLPMFQSCKKGCMFKKNILLPKRLQTFHV